MLWVSFRVPSGLIDQATQARYIFYQAISEARFRKCYATIPEGTRVERERKKVRGMTTLAD